MQVTLTDYLKCSIIIFCFIIMQNSCNSNVISNESDTMLIENLSIKEARIYYLHHSGWAIRTKNYLLIFDYCKRTSNSENLLLANGYINPNELKDENVFVFITHAHRDHFNPSILDWKNKIQDIKYIFGWEYDNQPEYINIVKEREKIEIDGLEIHTINHSFDEIPEVAFLVSVDSLLIYHSGDHAAFTNNVFKNNINYLSEIYKDIDILFHMAVDGGCRWSDLVVNAAFYTIEKMNPKVMFPMHGGSCESYYDDFADKAIKENIETQICCAKKRGDAFFYQKGNIKEFKNK